MYNLEELKSILVVEVAERLGIKVTKNKAMCFNNHDKKTPSLSFNTKENYWYCFGCNEGGNPIQLVQKVLRINFVDACHWLSKEFSITSGYSKDRSLTFNMNQFIQGHKSISEKIDRANPHIEVYEWLVNYCTLDTNAYKYLVKDRKFNKEVIMHFNVKSIENPTQVFHKAKSVWGIDRLLKCGLAKISDRDTPVFIWTSPVILFPFYNLDNRIEYLQGRQIGDREPRYINLNGIRTHIYSINVLNQIGKNDFLYICEGITDVLSAYQMGIKAIGILGANNFKDEWVYYFTNYRIRIIPDSDKGGNEFAINVQNAFRKIGKPVQIIKLKDAKDLTEYRVRRCV
ncbi:CHC2 zinc finger domain-containing protein [Acetivibrio straminisolvens]|jgi:DNA primase catalytic core|uniref:DNA primase n=1 Tax=Acetivibrio straminisolvens JCM 21531 TaxID=1294263 RepID=W4V570_9FIRM|nr:CHC2 zinc finger domain-containing protein [Acetivibrio straminisolvens]GAE87923.1 DNA primase [Acetivibrio straminisolvens JCM 21531]